MVTPPAIFKWWQTEPGLILCAVRWYLRYSLSLRDIEELLEEPGLNVDHTTVWRWVQYYGPELEQRPATAPQADQQVVASRELLSFIFTSSCPTESASEHKARKIRSDPMTGTIQASQFRIF